MRTALSMSVFLAAGASGATPPHPMRPHYDAARAAWLSGDATALVAAVAKLDGETSDDANELRAMATLAAAAKGGKLRRVVIDRVADSTAAFAPKMGIPIIEAKLNGEVVRLILDTGAELTVLDHRVAEKQKLRRPQGALVTASGNTGKQTLSLAIVDALSVLGLELAEVPVALADLSALPSQLGVVGIIGAQQLLDGGVLTIDYAAGKVSRSAASRVEGVSLLRVGGRAIVAVVGRVEGGAQGLFRVDTGGRRTVLTNEYVDAALKSGAPWNVSAPAATEVRAVGVVTRQRRTLAEGRWCAETGSVLCMDLAGVPVDTTAADSLARYAGKLGADVFRGKILELDYPAARMRLTAPSQP